MCLSWAGVSGTSILKEVAPELNLERQACLASKTSEKHSRQIKWEEQRQNRHESIPSVGELQVDRNDGTWVDADECGSREKRSGQALDQETLIRQDDGFKLCPESCGEPLENFQQGQGGLPCR